MQKWVLIIASSMALTIPLHVNALNLGDVTVHSELYQTLKADIPLLDVKTGELDALSATLASSSAFSKAGLERPEILTQLRFKLAIKPDGKPFLQVTSLKPINEPVLNYLVEVNWKNGHWLKEFTMLLDPPSVLAATPVTVDPRTVSRPSSRVKLPTSESPQSASLAGNEPSASRPASKVQRSSYGPTKKGEGLWVIARKLLPKKSVSTHQMMLALLAANPKAFSGNNINTLKTKQVLRVPPLAEVKAGLSSIQAIDVVNRQIAEWKDPAYRQALKTLPPAASTDNQSEANLKLVAATDSVAETLAPDSRLSDELAAQLVEIQRLGKDLTLANEAVEAKAQENAELTSRLAELDTQNSSVLRLITLKNEEILDLRTRLAELQKHYERVLFKVEQAALAATVSNTIPSATLITSTADSVAGISASLSQLTGEISRKPIAQGLFVLLALMLASIIWIMIRRRRNDGELIDDVLINDDPFAEQVAEQVALNVEPVVAAAPQTMPPTAAPVLNKVNKVIAEPALPRFLLEDKDLFSAPAQDLKLSATEQAGVVGTAGKDHQKQIELLEGLHIARNKHAFLIQAEALHADLGGKGGSEWDKVVAMGKDLDPGNPLFADVGATDDRAVQNASLGDAESRLDAGTKPHPAGETAPAYDFGYKFDFDFEKENDLLARATAQLSQPTPGMLREELGLEHDMPAVNDEVETKLSLAKAYIEMGDPAGAQDILDEVIKEGDDGQKQEAQDLMQRVG